jgi:hypothetical protein
MPERAALKSANGRNPRRRHPTRSLPAFVSAEWVLESGVSRDLTSTNALLRDIERRLRLSYFASGPDRDYCNVDQARRRRADAVFQDDQRHRQHDPSSNGHET